MNCAFEVRLQHTAALPISKRQTSSIGPPHPCTGAIWRLIRTSLEIGPEAPPTVLSKDLISSTSKSTMSLPKSINFAPGFSKAMGCSQWASILDAITNVMLSVVLIRQIDETKEKCCQLK